jgi:RNA polymerase sigma-54 factor
LEEARNEEAPSNQKDEEEPSGTEVDFDEEFSRLAELDDEWREYYQQSGSYNRISEDQEKKRRFYEDSITTHETLQEHLLQQWNLFSNMDGDKALGELIIGNIDENGYLTLPLEELGQTSEVPLQNLERVLKIIQTFHPVGVGARNLSECLLLQLTRLGKGDGPEAKIVSEYLNDLGKKNYSNIAKGLNISLTETQRAAELIGTLEPKPGRIFDTEKPHYAIPDVVVDKVGEDYVVMLNDDRIPHLRISNLYRGLMKDKSLETETKDYIRNKVQSGKWLVKNIQLRQQTLFNIAQTIVKEQKDFLDHGVSHLKPLTMQMVASQVGIHESTVSRAIANKYMTTPRGLFQMKYFFTPGLQSQTGENVSTTNIKEMLDELIAKEDHQKPMSDQEIVEALKAKGINVARRTVTKYRKELKILPSNLRKKF